MLNVVMLSVVMLNLVASKLKCLIVTKALAYHGRAKTIGDNKAFSRSCKQFYNASCCNFNIYGSQTLNVVTTM